MVPSASPRVNLQVTKSYTLGVVGRHKALYYWELSMSSRQTGTNDPVPEM